jgi:two-component system, NarL family, response regulator LiaR
VSSDGRIRVVLADADPLARRALREALLDEPDLEVVAEAADPEQTIRAAQGERPDVVFVDCELSDVDHATELRLLRRAAPSSAVIMLSAATDDDAGLGILVAGADGYLGKSTDLALLPRVVRSVARGEAAISRQLTLRVLDRMRRTSPRGDGIRPVKSDLSDRQWEVIDLLRKRLAEPEIAAALGISPSRVRRHVTNLLAKLEASSVDELVEIAQRLCFEAATADPNS